MLLFLQLQTDCNVCIHLEVAVDSSDVHVAS